MSVITVVMESFEEDDDLPLSVHEKPSSPLPKPKLKRLKKASSPSLPRSLENPGVPDAPTIPISPGFPEPSENRTGSSAVKEIEGFGEKTVPAQDLDPLFTYRSGEEMLSGSYVPEVDVNEIKGGNDEEEVVVEESKKEKNVKRRLSLEDGEEDLTTRKKKKGRSRKPEDPDAKPKESVLERKRIEKARKAELEYLHAESQRLLRETRNASFKPVQLIQKPISSVLEKIRLRKLEILKSSNILRSLPSAVDADSTAGSDCNSDPVNGKEDDKNANVAFDAGSKDTHKNLTNDAQAEKSGSQLSAGVDNPFNSQEVNPPSYPPISSLKIDGGGNDDGDASSGDYDVSSSEEESDKENISPSVCDVVSKGSSLKADLAKAFLDDEAEEEDDSDCDLSRFQENEEENESDEHEELDDLITTAYEEVPMDEEKRNELHQKWLEQQDAAETDNLLQRLKSGRRGLRKPSLIHGEHDTYDGSDDDDDEGNDSDDDGDDEALHKNRPMDASRQSLKRAKQMISSMFTDANDVYIPSDDEETEKNLIRHNLLKHLEEPSLISPVEDESSRDFFGLIKKLNIAPSTKKRGKASAPLFDSLALSGSSNSSSKCSFLNRATNSLPSSHKQGSISVRAFIFGRDDSNSRSNISASSLTVEKEGASAKNSIKEKSSSQAKRKAEAALPPAAAESGSGTLFNILRKSSIQFDKKLEAKHSSVSSGAIVTENEAAAAAYKFSAFKLNRNSKMGSRT